MWKKKKINVAAQAIRQEGWNSSFLCTLLYSGPQQMGQCSPTLGRSAYFIECTDANANITPKLTHTHPEIMICQISRHPGIQSSWHVKLTITGLIYLPDLNFLEAFKRESQMVPSPTQPSPAPSAMPTSSLSGLYFWDETSAHQATPGMTLHLYKNDTKHSECESS